MAATLPIDVEISSSFVIDAAELGRLRQPALIMYGEQSPSWLTAPPRAIATALPKSRLKALPNQGHNAIFSDPGAVAAAIISFVESSD
jgi:pimeloyl-ACP methyl ester carboxylesterase